MRGAHSWFHRLLCTGLVLVAVLMSACAARRPLPSARPQAWCNRGFSTRASVWPLPATDELVVPGGSTQAAGSLWLVVWATWCKPCLDELPRMEEALRRAAARGLHPEVLLLSIDENPAALASAAAGGAAVLRQARLVRARSADGFDAWVQRLGLDRPQVTLPIHVLADATGAVLCVHTGALLDEEVDLPGTILQR